MDDACASRIEALFHAARALPPSARAAFLAVECADDTALRAEVESLLDAGPPGRSILDRSPVAALLGNADLAGTRVGAWELVREIGRGGMGAVFLARRADGQYEQLAAVKLLHAAATGASRAEIVRRFREERQLLAALDHPHIARLLDGGALDDGTPWLAMEFIEGRPIDRFCRERTLPRRPLLSLFRDVCLAVAHAHSRLIAHRDLKPANILVRDAAQPGAPPEPRLLDFGIAKLLGETPTRGGRDPAATIARLTPAYASPEQFRGEPATAATDVYALGAILYELLTGRLPHDPATLAPHEFARCVCEERPRRPSESCARLDRDLENVVLRALEKVPARRYATAAALADELDRFLTGHPVVARPASPAYRLWKTVQRHRLPFAIGAAAIVALAGSSAWMAVLWRRALDSEQKERERFAEASDARENSDATARLFVDLFGAPDPFERSGRDVTVVQALDAGLPRLERELAGKPRLQASLRWMAARTFVNLGRFDRAREELRKCVATLREILGEEHAETLRAMSDLATACAELQRTDEALPLLRRVLELAPRSPELRADPTFLLTVRQALGTALSFAGRLDEAEQLLTSALADSRRELGASAPLVAQILNSLAGVQRGRGDTDSAKHSSAEALRITRSAFGPDHPETLNIELGQAVALHEAHESAAAEALLRELLPRLDHAFGPANPHSLSALRLLGMSCAQQGRMEEARTHLESALAQARAVHGDAHPETFDAQHDLGQFLCLAGRFDEAEPLARALVDSATRARGADEPSTLLYRFLLGAALRGSGRAAEAEEWLRGVVEAALDAGLPEELDLVDTARRGLAFALWDQKLYDEAEGPLQDSLDALKGAAAVPEERVAERFEDLASLYVAWGREADAARVRADLREWRAARTRAGGPPP